MTEEQIKSLIEVKQTEISGLKKELEDLILKRASYSVFDVFMNTHGSLYAITDVFVNINDHIIYRLCGITRAIDGEKQVYVESNYSDMSEWAMKENNFLKLGVVEIDEFKRVKKFSLNYDNNI